MADSTHTLTPPPQCDAWISRRASHIRSASSAYPSSHNTPRMQSPVSEYCRGNRLSLSGLSRFGRTNDCLSNLRSSSPSSNQQAVGDTSNQELMADAAAAITEWQGISRPVKSATYNNYSLADSSDLFPSDSLSQRGDFSLSPSSPPSQQSARGPAQHAQDYFKPLDSQYDGTVDADRNRSPEPKDGLTFTATQTFHRSKRKVSQLSLRSLTRSLSKRPRLMAFRQWAANVYHDSSRRLSGAYHRLKYQRKALFHAK
ncbi:hypothetical protein J3458_020597 [Metarhizium acridum]|uniref:uncharacterized protein n=1 Tax=Metarhizium acridum TaxID=92637 RepID=UPI001C6B07BE|nr:hypothetical protein J3458_020597 [Metarhizium acridum]